MNTMRERAMMSGFSGGVTSGGIIVMPGDTLDYIQTIDRQVKSMSGDVATKEQDLRNRAPLFLQGWYNFNHSWAGFYTDTTSGPLGGWTSRLTGETYDQAERYQRELVNWRNEFARLGGQPSTPAPIIPSEDPGFKSPMSTLQKGLVIGGVALGVGAIVAGIVYTSRDGTDR
jgi:hypothetical protein